jgi:hypothetical protein
MAERSPLLQEALARARAEEARHSAEQARELADAERALARAKSDAETQRQAANLADLADKQRALAEKAARLAEETKQSARTARAQPLRADDARRAADALKDGDAREALLRQEMLARNLDRLADGLDRSLESGRDPREAARQLAKLQDDLRQRVQDEMYRKNADKPLADRLAELSKDQEAIRKAVDALSVPPDDNSSRQDRQTASEEAGRAADKLRNQDPRSSLGSMEQTRRALESLSNRMPAQAQRQQQALLDTSRLRREQEEVSKQVDEVARDAKADESAKARDGAARSLQELAKRQAELLNDLDKIDPANREARRERVANAMKRALADLQKGLPEDSAVSQHDALREMQRLEESLGDKKPADEMAQELARRQQQLAADADRAKSMAPEQKSALAKRQQDLANQITALPSPEAPQRQAEAERAARTASKEAAVDPTSQRTREAMQDAARKLDDLAKQMSNRESDAERADRLARRQAKLAEDAERLSKDNQDKSPSSEQLRSQNEVAREAEQLRGGEQGRSAKRNADRALSDAQKPLPPEEQVRAQKQAAAALRELADRIASRKDERAAGDADQAPASIPDAVNAPLPGMPTRQQGVKARELANEQRKLRDAVRKAANDDHADAPKQKSPSDDPLGEIAKRQEEVARQSKELAREITREQGEQAPLTREGENAHRSAQQAADELQVGELPTASKAGKAAERGFHQLAEDLARTPRGANENPDKDFLRRSRDLARQQEQINRAVDEQGRNPDNRLARQQARQQELRKQTGDLEKELERLRQEMSSTPKAGDAASQAARAARDAQKQMEQASKSSSSQANRSQEQAARSLDRTAQQADRAASEQASAADGRGQQKSGSPEAGQSVRQAQGQMDQAQKQLGQGEPGQAKGSMEKAARALQQAAGQLAQGGRPNPDNNPDSANSLGPNPGGRPDPSVYGPAAAKFAGKGWGELPGELRTKIVQDMRVKYGEDYARMIKLYFEQLADTKREAK